MQLSREVNPQPNEGDGADRVDAATRANRYDVLSRVADDLAHEIKNPLNAIVVNLEVMRRRVASGAADAALDRAAVIEHEIRRVHGLIEQLLQLTRPAKREATSVAVDALLESLAPVWQIQAKAAHVPFSCHAAAELYARVGAEALKFALLNLVVYAIDAEAQAGGAVEIAASRTGSDINVVMKCTKARLGWYDEPVAACRALMNSAGGALESVEPTSSGVGSTATLVMPPGNFV